MKRKKSQLILSFIIAVAVGTAAAVGIAFTVSHLKKPKVTMEEARVELGEYRNIPVVLEERAVTDDSVDNYIRSMLNYYNTYVQNERTVIEDGDTVYANIYLVTEDGRVEGSPDDPGYPSNDNFITIGAGNVYPEIEQALIGIDIYGADVYDSLSVPVTLPSGEEAVVYVTVGYILADAIEFDGMTNEQAAVLMKEMQMEGNTVENLRSSVREILEEQNGNNQYNEKYAIICDYLLETCTVNPFPDLELKTRVDAQIADMDAMIESYYGMSMSKYFDSLEMTEKSYRNEVTEAFTKNIRLELILYAIGEAEGISYTEEEYGAYVEELMASYGYTSEEDLNEIFPEKEYVRKSFYMELVMDWLMENAAISYTEAE